MEPAADDSMGDQLEQLDSKRIAVKDINQYLTCALCSGYLIDAVTVAECLHSFCKSCFADYLEKPMLVERRAGHQNISCPACLSPLTKSRDSALRDTMLQDVVFKCIPHLQAMESERRAEFTYRFENIKPDNAASSAATRIKDFPVYVVLDYISPSELKSSARNSGHPFGNSTLSNSPSSFGRSEKNASNCSESRSLASVETSGLYAKPRLYICCSSKMPLGTLKRFLSLKFDSEAVLFGSDELFDGAHWLEIQLGELLALRLCASVRGDQMRCMFELDPDGYFAHFYFALL